MFSLNDALQPFQVLQGQAGLNISWSHNANRPLLLHSRQFVLVCVSVCACDYTYVVPPHSYTPAVPPVHFDHSLFLVFTGLTEFVHVSPTPVCDLLPCYTI